VPHRLCQSAAVDSGSGRRGPISVAATATFAFVAVAWLVLAVGHLGDRYAVDQASGASSALADRAGDGVLYPELFDGDTFAGTRYMPVGTVVHGALARLTGNLIAGGKLMSGAAAVATVALVLVALRRLGTSTPLSLGLVGLLVATRPFVFTSFDLRSDTLAVALQLGALLAIWPGSTRRAATGGGALAALAVLAKFTSVWALIAGAAWLWSRRRADLRPFLTGALAAGGLVGGGAVLWSRGRMLEQLLRLGGPEVFTTSAPGDAADNLVETLHASGPPALLLLAVGGAAWLGGVLRRGAIRDTPFALAIVSAATITVVVFTDWGAGYNHFLDLLVLATLAIGTLSVDVAGRAERLAPSVTVATCGLALLATTAVLVPDALDVGEEQADQVVDPLASLSDIDGPVLVEDALVVLAAGREPVVLDPYMYRFLAQDHPDWDAVLVARVDAAEFEAIVLDHPITDADWYEHFFSPGVLAAIGRAYELDGLLGDRFVYRPL
jgi:hypothetical protein